MNAKGETALYTYNGLGHRVGKTTGAIHPEKKIQYTIDLTKSYHNLLQKEEDGNTQSYLWDANVAGMTEDGQERYYLQDEMGSPIRLMDKDGDLKDSYGYDEFGQDLYDNQGILQPFGYTGYQADRITGTYYAQAREYRAELGRFAAVDTIKGFTAAPYTLNEYGYCWNNPKKYVDLNGKNPVEILRWGVETALVTSQIDSPAPGPADVVALVILGAALLIAGVVAIYELVTTKVKVGVKVRAKVESEEKEKTLVVTTTKVDDFTLIYRLGSGNATNLTPRESDPGGLSYYLRQPVGEDYTVTSIEAVNSTGVLTAVIDGPNHVSVRPTNISELPIWIASRPTAKENPYYLTTILSSISIKVRGGKCDVFSD